MSGPERARDEAKSADAEDGLVVVACVVKPRGIRGEVACELLTDFPERFEGLEELIALTPAGEQCLVEVERAWLHGGRVVLKIAGYDNPEDARVLVGYQLAVPESDAVELEEDEYYDWQLEGCRVETVGGVELGRVRSVWHTGAAPVLVIRGDAPGAPEHLVPLAKAICVEIDVEGKRIRVDPPEGLVEF
ncbi:MAG: ribosome maturation factor RimM [Pyrinomonadaceae bacterium]